MNLETLDLLSSKVEKALETIRQLKTEKARLEEQLASLGETNKRLRAELEEKDQTVASLSTDLERRSAELQMLHETVQDRDVKIQMAAERLEHVMATLETELGGALNLGNTNTATVSEMSPEQAQSLFSASEETARAEAQPSFFDYGGTNH